MPLHLRKRGEIYHARGTVRVGRQTVDVREFSTGARGIADAKAIAAAEEAKIRADTLDGPAGRARRVTIAEALEAYLTRPGGVIGYDISRLGSLNIAIGSRPISDAAPAWTGFLKGQKWAPATAARWRAIYVAALKAGCASLGLPDPPKVPTVRERQEERTAHLHDDERKRMLGAYNRHASGPILLLAYAGLRTQEALQLDWHDVDFTSRVLIIGRTKSAKGRAVPMHRRVDGLLFGLWHTAGQPERGRVFLSSKGAGYSDTRAAHAGDGAVGGNPLATAHRRACRIAGVKSFRVHDWRHDFATRFLTEGGDVRSLMQIMGWSSPRMVARYVTYRADHLAAVLAKVA